MSTSKHISHYPESMLHALRTAQRDGSLKIPVPNPAAVRLQFHGLFRALRLANRPEECDGIMLTLSPKDVARPYLLLTKNAVNPVNRAIEKAISKAPTPQKSEEDLLLERLSLKL